MPDLYSGSGAQDQALFLSAAGSAFLIFPDLKQISGKEKDPSSMPPIIEPGDDAQKAAI